MSEKNHTYIRHLHFKLRASVFVIWCVRMESTLSLGQLFVILLRCYNSVCHPDSEFAIKFMFGKPSAGSDLSVSGRNFQLHVDFGLRPVALTRSPLLKQYAQLGTA